MIKQIIKTSLLILLLITSVVLNVYLYLNPQVSYSYQNSVRKIYYSNKSSTQVEVENLIAIQPIQNNSIYQSGWIPDWDLSDGFSTLKDQKQAFNSISPFWLLPQEDGTVKEILNKVNPEILAYTKANGIKLIPTVTLFDFEVLSKILNDTNNLDRHVNSILEKIDKYNYDGIDLDYESISLSDKKLFFKFLSKLSSEVHKRGKTLSFTALPKWGDEITYPSLPQTRLVQDYKEIGNLVDELRIMTYDFFGRTSTEVGPIAPIDWMERVVQYAIKVGVPRNKIVLGVPTYAYDWSDRPVSSSIDLINWYGNLANIQGLEPGDAYYYSAVEKVIKDYSMQYEFNEDWGEAVGRYTFEGKLRIVVFPTQKSIDLRKDLAQKYGIKGVAIWRLGDEGSLRY